MFGLFKKNTAASTAGNYTTQYTNARSMSPLTDFQGVRRTQPREVQTERANGEIIKRYRWADAAEPGAVRANWQPLSGTVVHRPLSLVSRSFPIPTTLQGHECTCKQRTPKPKMDDP